MRATLLRVTCNVLRVTVFMRLPLSWLKEFVDIRMKPDVVAHLLTMGGLEVELQEKVADDTIFELGVTPNRPDCLAVVGVARELAALTRKRLRIPRIAAAKGKRRISDFIQVSVKAAKGCPRYSARVIDCVRVGPSPSWLVNRLAACGVRSINNVVDATNYVMLELGQPLHAFDYRFLREGKIIVANPKEPFEFETLDEVKRSIMPADLLINDGEGAVALAGVMGGKNSEVQGDTMTVVLESAYFEPTGIRRTSKRLGLVSESSRRFERGVDPNGTVNALHRLTSIICEIAGGTPTIDWVDIESHSFTSLKIRLEMSEIKHILGVDIPAKEIKSILTRLGMVAIQTGKIFVVKVPTHRPDITRPIDVIEEIARLYGYHRIEPTMPHACVTPLVRPRLASGEELARNALMGCGFSEVVVMAFAAREDLVPFADVASAPIEISNPLSNDETVMRTVLLAGLLKAAATNQNRQRYDVRLFALQRVYLREGGDIDEPVHLGGILTGRRFFRNWDGNKETVDFYDAKGAVEAILKSLAIHQQAVWQRADDCRFLHPGRSAHVLLANRRAGFVGQLHPDVAKHWDIDSECFVFEMDFEMLANLSLIERPRFSELSRFPFVERDLALIVDESIPSLEVLRAIQNSGVPLVSDVRVFDVYRGKGITPGKKSMAYTIRYSSPERTLTDDEVNDAHNSIIKTLQEKLGAVLRT